MATPSLRPCRTPLGPIPGRCHGLKLYPKLGHENVCGFGNSRGTLAYANISLEAVMTIARISAVVIAIFLSCASQSYAFDNGCAAGNSPPPGANCFGR
jgi:hypothetical protein